MLWRVRYQDMANFTKAERFIIGGSRVSGDDKRSAGGHGAADSTSRTWTEGDYHGAHGQLSGEGQRRETRADAHETHATTRIVS